MTVVGTGIGGYNGDDIPATEAMIQYPYGIFVTEQDELYFADYCNSRIRKVFNGIVTTVAGTGIDGYNGDGQLAMNTQLNDPWFVTVVSGEVYIAEYDNNRIRKILRNGIITTLAGTDGYNVDGISATSVQLSSPNCVFVTNNGEMFISTIAGYAGVGIPGYSGDVPFDFQKYIRTSIIHDEATTPKA